MTTYQYATVHGLKVFYREAGSKDSPTIVLLHGFPSSSHMYRDLIPQLAEKFHVVAPDYIGFGYSDAPDVTQFTYTFDNLAANVEELLFGVLGLIFSILSIKDARAAHRATSGFAVAGLIISIAEFVLAFVIIAILIITTVLFASAVNSYTYPTYGG